MTLNQYLLRHHIKTNQLAKQLDVSPHAVAKWRQKKRIPRPAMVNKIVRMTRGKVGHEDWY